MKNQTEKEALISKREALERLGGISPTTLWRWIQRGIILPVRIEGSRRVFFKESDIRDLIEKSSI